MLLRLDHTLSRHKVTVKEDSTKWRLCEPLPPREEPFLSATCDKPFVFRRLLYCTKILDWVRLASFTNKYRPDRHEPSVESDLIKSKYVPISIEIYSITIKFYWNNRCAALMFASTCTINIRRHDITWACIDDVGDQRPWGTLWCLILKRLEWSLCRWNSYELCVLVRGNLTRRTWTKGGRRGGDQPLMKNLRNHTCMPY